MTMTLPLLDTFNPPYEVWKTRPATPEEMIANRSMREIKVSLDATIADAIEAAKHIANVREDNCLGNHIQCHLDRSNIYKVWQAAMPPRTPTKIAGYQKDYKNCELARVSVELNKFGKTLEIGQHLFHGGLWTNGDSFITNRPLSTSLCPQVALRNAEWMGKAYNANRLDLFVLRITKPTIKAFSFKRKGTSNGHESEVLIASSVSLVRTNEIRVRNDYPSAHHELPPKEIPIFVLEVEVS
jgi:hypothetical protein